MDQRIDHRHPSSNDFSATIQSAQASNGTSGFPCKSLVAAVQPIKRRGQGALGARCDFIGSPTNLIMVTSTSSMLFAGRFGLVPSANREATAGLKLEVMESGLQTGDPAGFTLGDTLACGCTWSQRH